MPQRSPIALALLASAALGLPGGVAAASLGPLHGVTATGAVLPGLDMPLPHAPARHARADTLADALGPIVTGPIVTGPVLGAPRPFKFENDTGLDPNPLRSVLPENQWANPQAAEISRIRR